MGKYRCRIKQLHELLRDKVCNQAGKEHSPSLACMDSQSVKTTRLGGECRGFDGGKMIKGSKRHIVTDTMGLLLTVVVHAANGNGSKGASDVIALIKGRFEGVVKIVAYGGYRGKLIGKTKNHIRLNT